MTRVHFRWLDEQERRNRDTSGLWELFAEHRQRVTDLLLQAGAEQAKSSDKTRLCILGAGNCNDLDLPRLVERFERIHLVDWDGQALARGVAQQQCEHNSKIFPHGGFDLLGFADPTSGWTPYAPYFGGLGVQTLDVVRNSPVPNLGERNQVVASVCLLSQLIESMTSLLGEDHNRHLECIQAVRKRHMQQLVELLDPGGTGLLISDVVSSETAPQLLDAQDFEINALLADLIAQRNFFSGLNPAVLLNELASDSDLSSLVEQISPISPWRWSLGSRVYAVYGIQFRRRLDS